MRRYRALACVPHGPLLLAAAVIFYPGQAGLGIAVLLALHHVTGSFAAAGAAGAAETICFSVSSLVQGRLLDRRDPRALVGLAVAFVIAIVAITIVLSTGANVIVLVALTAAIGATMPGTGAAQRAVWSSLLSESDQRATAFAYLSLAQDAGFMLGPAALGGIAATVSPQLALGCGCALICTGTAAVVAVVAAGDGVPVGASAAQRQPGSLLGAIGIVAVLLVTVGIAFGATDVSCAAFATEHHHQSLAGLLLAALAAGSVAGGFWYGAQAWHSALDTRLGCCAALLGLLGLGPALAPNLAIGLPLLVLAGLPAGPALTTAYLLATDLAPTGRQTQAYSVLAVAINGGAALGATLGGQLIAGASARGGFLLAAGSPLLGCATLIVARASKHSADPA